MSWVDYEVGKLKSARMRLEQARVLLRGAREERESYLHDRLQAIRSGERIRPVPETAATLARMQAAVDYAEALEAAFAEEVSAAEAALEKALEVEPTLPRQPCLSQSPRAA